MEEIDRLNWITWCINSIKSYWTS